MSTTQPISQAGAIVIRGTTDGPLVLIVRGSRYPHPWLFPKGHIEDGESEDEAAVRELREEAGVLGALVGRVGETEYEKNGRRYHVVYFLFEPVEVNIPHEPRAQQWVAHEEAMERLELGELKRLLSEAMTIFRSIASG
jgi:ADP-ribose pyrophosphatase YjhB (NUDIX family)